MSMTLDQFLLGKIAEECSKVAQRALKAQQFGLGEVQEGQSLNNIERLVHEVYDLRTVIDELLEGVGYETNPTGLDRQRKLRKMARYHDLSARLGMVRGECPEHWRE